MPAPVDPELIARVLVSAVASGDKAAAKAAGISLRTLRRWKKRTETCPDVAASVQCKKDEFNERWQDQIDATMEAGIQTLCLQFKEVECSPDAIHAIAGGVKILSEIQQAERFLSARLDRQAPETGGKVIQIASRTGS